MSKYKVLALATCFNRSTQTQICLESLIYGNPEVEFHFIIVDDGSTDNTYETLNMFSNVIALKGNGSLYYSGGMRMAINEAKKSSCDFDYCMLFNDDVNFFPRVVERIISLANPQRKIIVGATCDSNGKLTYAGVKKTSKWMPKCEIVFSEGEDLISCDTFNANCVLIDYHIFMELENIDPVYIHGMGDYDYGFNATRRGIKAYVANFYCGECDETTEQGSWRDSKLSRKKRLEIKNNAKGTPHKVWFHYLLKNYNPLTAIVYSVSPYVRILLGK